MQSLGKRQPWAGEEDALLAGRGASDLRWRDLLPHFRWPLPAHIGSVMVQGQDRQEGGSR